MKVFLLYRNYYDYCDNWEILLGIYDSEDKAVMAQILEEEKPEYKINSDQYSTHINTMELK